MQKELNINISQSVQAACNKIAPLWSLENYVAVNPYLGFLDLSFEAAASKVNQAGARITMPISFYLDEFNKGNITKSDLAKALKNSKLELSQDTDAFILNAEQQLNANDIDRVLLVVDIAEKISDHKWSVLITDRITNWASAYFDKGQALWKTSDKNCNLYESWRSEALVDKTPVIAGLKNFHQTLNNIPSTPAEAIEYCLEQLEVPTAGQETYLYTLLMKVGGWSAYCSGIDWDNNLYGGATNYKESFLAVLLAWELCLLKGVAGDKLNTYWQKFKKQLPELQASTKTNEALKIQLCLQSAYDIATQRKLIEKVNTQENTSTDDKITTKVQAFFCIDVRSEVYRRNLEMIAPEVETKGFAGFFGMAVDYSPSAQENSEKQCPVLIPAGPKVQDDFNSTENNEKVAVAKKSQQEYLKAWKSFKSGAVTGFSFVSSLGLTYIPKLISDTFGFTRPSPNPSEAGLNEALTLEKDVQLNISIEEQIKMGHAALTAMSLKSDFAKLVLFAGHGSSTVNNPHATGLDCGACGGRTGEVNARVAAKILNNPDVRKGVAELGIEIPTDTLFLAGLHDTTTDELTIYNQNQIPASHQTALNELKAWLQKAGQATRTERATRFSSDSAEMTDQSILFRSKDWSQVRPEWGLAGCDTFVVAPRARTKKVSLNGKSFLHEYNWKEDENSGVLTAIMSAPMVVTSWINLQYYASTVDQENFGAGNKTLHNVVGGFGVIEGQGGDLRTGLAMQSVHDGKNFQHLPARLNVVIEAPLEAMNSIIKDVEVVKNLCDNNWIQLLAMNENGKISHRYTGNLEWEVVES